MSEPRTIVMAEPGLDRALLCVAALLLLVGWVVTTSASMDFAADKMAAPWYFASRHLLYIVVACVAGFIVFMVPLHMWRDASGLCLLVVVGLLLLVLIPGIGVSQLGARRWLNLGFMTVQPSELAKVAVVIFVASYLVRHEYQVRNEWQGFALPMAVVALMAGLVLSTNDFGSTAIIAAVSLGMFFMAGVNLRYFSIAMMVVALVLVVAVQVKEHRIQRIVAFFEGPWADPYNDGFQVVQSLIAFGRGEWFGVGLGNSIQKLSYLTQAHTDFIFAIWAEETGFLGTTTVVLLFTFLVTRILLIARRALAQRELFGAYLCYGAALLFAGQAFINMGVSCGLLPAKGLTLPLVSSGGSSMIVCVALLALVLRTRYELVQSAQAGVR